jgi:hypothetical protein
MRLGFVRRKTQSHLEKMTDRDQNRMECDTKPKHQPTIERLGLQEPILSNICGRNLRTKLINGQYQVCKKWF